MIMKSTLNAVQNYCTNNDALCNDINIKWCRPFHSNYIIWNVDRNE